LCFIWSFSVTPFKSLTEYCTCNTICIRVYYVYCTCGLIRYLGINKWVRVLVGNVWAVGEFWQSCSFIPNWYCCNLLLPAIPLLGVAMRAGPPRLGPPRTPWVGPPRPTHFMRAAYSGPPRIYVGPWAHGLTRFLFFFYFFYDKTFNV